MRPKCSCCGCEVDTWDCDIEANGGLFDMCYKCIEAECDHGNPPHHRIVSHGIVAECFFAGDGVALTEFNSVYIGVGESAYAALEDAKWQAEMCGKCCALIPNSLSNYEGEPGEDEHWYVSLFI